MIGAPRADRRRRHGYDLTGYRKMYADRKRIRIVYSIVEELVLVKIIAIGRRADDEVKT